MLRRAIFCGCKAHCTKMVRAIILKYLNFILFRNLHWLRNFTKCGMEFQTETYNSCKGFSHPFWSWKFYREALIRERCGIMSYSLSYVSCWFLRFIGAYKWMHINIMYWVVQTLQKKMALQCKAICFHEIREFHVFSFFERELSALHVFVRPAIVLMSFWAVTLCTYTIHVV